MQVLQSQSDFSDVEPGVALGEGPHLVQVSEHLTTTHIVCVVQQSMYNLPVNHQMQTKISKQRENIFF